ncbi:fungal-specific transcription factor domain-containing protein [Dipodascopsis uninucleata]
MSPVTSSSGNLSRQGPPRRLRVIISCTECHRRKQKCDRKSPCNQCIGRGVQHLCKYAPKTKTSSTRGKGSQREGEKSEKRISSAMSTYREHSPSRSNASSSDFEEDGYLTSSSLDSNYKSDDAEDIDGSLGYFKYGVDNIAKDIADLKLASKLVSFSGIPRQQSADEKMFSRHNKMITKILKIMPPDAHVDLLLELYFSEVNFYQAVNKYEFFDRLNKWRSASTMIDSVAVPAVTLRIMSIAILFVPEEHVPFFQQLNSCFDSLSREYHRAANDLAELLPESIDKVLESMLRVCWLKSHAQMKDCWYMMATTIRMAQEIKLNVEEPNTPLTCERENRRRLWWMLYDWDHMLGLILSRPCMLITDSCQVPFPLDISDDSFFPEPKPAKSITKYTGQLLAFQLSKHLINLDTDPNQVFSDLSSFVSSLPPYFAPLKPDTSLDTAYPFLAIERENLATLICMVLCALYRRKVKIANPLGFCLRLLDAAEHTYDVIRESQYRHFNIVYQNLEPSVLICREILRATGTMAESHFVLFNYDDDGSDFVHAMINDNDIIDVWTCLNAIDNAATRLKIIRTRNKLAIKAYRILKELRRRLNIIMDREKARFAHLQANSLEHQVHDQQLQMSSNSESPFSWSVSPDRASLSTKSGYDGLDDTVVDKSIHDIFVSVNSAASSIAPVSTPVSQPMSHPVEDPGMATNVAPSAICGKIQIRMPEITQFPMSSNGEQSISGHSVQQTSVPRHDVQVQYNQIADYENFQQSQQYPSSTIPQKGYATAPIGYDLNSRQFNNANIAYDIVAGPTISATSNTLSGPTYCGDQMMFSWANDMIPDVLEF